MPKSTCAVDGCERSHLAKGYCRKHYSRVRRTGTTEEPPAREPSKCAVGGCESPNFATGYCQKHYARLRRTGSTADPAPRERLKCSVEACDALAMARGWCLMHYKRWRNHGTPEGVRAGKCLNCSSPVRAGVRGRIPELCGQCLKERHRQRERVRRASKEGAGSTPFCAQEIYERDCWQCQHCGKKLDPSIRWPDPLSVSLDHVIPLSMGGWHGPENAQTLCLGCNRSKGARWVG